MNASIWAIRNPVPVILLFVLLSFGGLWAFAAMKVQNFPDIDVPTVTIRASLPGASPTQLETEVARRMEDALANTQGIKHISSRLSDGEARITAEFRLEKPVQQAVDDVRDALSRIRAELPGELREPVIRKEEIADSPILSYTVASPRLDDEALSWFVDKEISRALLAVPGVGELRRVGGVDRELRVELMPDRLLALNATVADISRQLRRTQQEAASGRVSLGGVEQSVRTIATVGSAAEVGAIELTLSDGRRIRLDQVAMVSDTVAERRSAALLDGAPVVGFEILRARGHGEIEVAEGVRAALAALQARQPEMVFTEAFDFTEPVAESYAASMQLLYEGAALAVLVIFLFLRDGRATLIAAIALPLSLIPTFMLMHAMGFSLNIATLLALSLVVGVVVDDAIVEIENIERHLRMGKPPRQAAMDAATEIGLAVLATTFTLIAVFLPTAFMSGTVGKFFVQFGWTAAGAVFFSLVVARLLTPMMAAYLLRPPAQQAAPEPAWLRAYLRLAAWCLRHRALTLSAAAAFFAAGLGLAQLLPTAFIPPDDDAQTQVTLTLPPGSELADTLAMAERARLLLASKPHVRRVLTTIGAGGNADEESGSANVRTAVLTLGITPRAERTGLHKQEIELQLRAALTLLPGVRVVVGMGGSSEKYELVLTGEDNRLLEQHAALVERELRRLPGIGAVSSSASLLRPELVVRPDFARAADLGVATATIAETLRIATVGDYPEALAKLNLDERQVPVMVRLGEAARQDMETLKRLPLPGARGPVALENFAHLEAGSGPAEITRLNRMRNITIEVQLNGRPLGEVEQAALALPSLRQLPPGITQGALGDAEEMASLLTDFGMAMLTGVLCIYMVLVLLLKDFVQPGTILTALVLSVPGAILALFLAGSTLSMPSMIGLIMLLGIAAKNAILLVDYILIARREHHLDRTTAILDACRKRARPIIMTTLAMGGGMLPVALGLGGDPSFRAPMAIVVIGGLITSTVLSLLVVPVVYGWVDDGVRGRV